MRRRDFLRMAGTGLAVATAPAVILAPTRRFWPGADLVRPTTAEVWSITIAGQTLPVGEGVPQRFRPTYVAAAFDPHSPTKMTGMGEHRQT